MSIDDIIKLYEYFNEAQDYNEERYQDIQKVLCIILDDIRAIKEELGLKEELPF